MRLSLNPRKQSLQPNMEATEVVQNLNSKYNKLKMITYLLIFLLILGGMFIYFSVLSPQIQSNQKNDANERYVINNDGKVNEATAEITYVINYDNSGPTRTIIYRDVRNNATKTIICDDSGVLSGTTETPLCSKPLYRYNFAKEIVGGDGTTWQYGENNIMTVIYSNGTLIKYIPNRDGKPIKYLK